MNTMKTDPRYNTRPFAADTSDATRRLEDAIAVVMDVTGAERFYAEVDGTMYSIEVAA